MCLTFATVFHYCRRQPCPALPLFFFSALSIPLSSVTPHLRSEESASSVCLQRKKGWTENKEGSFLMNLCGTFQIEAEVEHTHTHQKHQHNLVFSDLLLSTESTWRINTLKIWLDKMILYYYYFLIMLKMKNTRGSRVKSTNEEKRVWALNELGWKLFKKIWSMNLFIQPKLTAVNRLTYDYFTWTSSSTCSVTSAEIMNVFQR